MKLTLQQIAEKIGNTTSERNVHEQLADATATIAALEAELDDTLTDKMKLWDVIPKPHHEQSVFLAGVHRITALEAEIAELAERMLELAKRAKDRSRYIHWDALFQFANELLSKEQSK